jgi:hypothetical protein
MRLGLEAVLNGSGKDLKDLKYFMKTVNDDFLVPTRAIQEAFLLALKTKGIPYEEVEV